MGHKTGNLKNIEQRIKHQSKSKHSGKICWLLGLEDVQGKRQGLDPNP